MREILFRGKRDDTGEWIEGDLRQDKDLGTSYILGYDYYTSGEGLQREPFEYEVIPESVGQYTGLIDRKGVKIFKGDIVSAYKNNDVPFTNVITFKKGCFWFGNWNWVEFLNMFRNVEVIGNIYDYDNIE